MDCRRGGRAGGNDGIRHGHVRLRRGLEEGRRSGGEGPAAHGHEPRRGDRARGGRRRALARRGARVPRARAGDGRAAPGRPAAAPRAHLPRELAPVALGRRRADEARRRGRRGEDAAVVAGEDRRDAGGAVRQGLRPLGGAPGPAPRGLEGALRSRDAARILLPDALRLRGARRDRLLRREHPRQDAREGPRALRPPDRVPRRARRPRRARDGGAAARGIRPRVRREAAEGARRGVRGVPRRLPRAPRGADGGRRVRRGRQGRAPARAGRARRGARPRGRLRGEVAEDARRPAVRERRRRDRGEGPLARGGAQLVRPVAGDQGPRPQPGQGPLPARPRLVRGPRRGRVDGRECLLLRRALHGPGQVCEAQAGEGVVRGARPRAGLQAADVPARGPGRSQARPLRPLRGGEREVRHGRPAALRGVRHGDAARAGAPHGRWRVPGLGPSRRIGRAGRRRTRGTLGRQARRARRNAARDLHDGRGRRLRRNRFRRRRLLRTAPRARRQGRRGGPFAFRRLAGLSRARRPAIRAHRPLHGPRDLPPRPADPREGHRLPRRPAHARLPDEDGGHRAADAQGPERKGGRLGAPEAQQVGFVRPRLYRARGPAHRGLHDQRLVSAEGRRTRRGEQGRQRRGIQAAEVRGEAGEGLGGGDARRAGDRDGHGAHLLGPAGAGREGRVACGAPDALSGLVPLVRLGRRRRGRRRRALRRAGRGDDRRERRLRGRVHARRGADGRPRERPVVPVHRDGDRHGRHRRGALGGVVVRDRDRRLARGRLDGRRVADRRQARPRPRFARFALRRRRTREGDAPRLPPEGARAPRSQAGRRTMGLRRGGERPLGLEDVGAGRGGPLARARRREGRAVEGRARPRRRRLPARLRDEGPEREDRPGDGERPRLRPGGEGARNRRAGALPRRGAHRQGRRHDARLLGHGLRNRLLPRPGLQQRQDDRRRGGARREPRLVLRAAHRGRAPRQDRDRDDLRPREPPLPQRIGRLGPVGQPASRHRGRAPFEQTPSRHAGDVDLQGLRPRRGAGLPLRPLARRLPVARRLARLLELLHAVGAAPRLRVSAERDDRPRPPRRFLPQHARGARPPVALVAGSAFAVRAAALQEPIERIRRDAVHCRRRGGGRLLRNGGGRCWRRLFHHSGCGGGSPGGGGSLRRQNGEAREQGVNGGSHPPRSPRARTCRRRRSSSPTSRRMRKAACRSRSPCPTRSRAGSC